jgi:hypothetical protein
VTGALEATISDRRLKRADRQLSSTNPATIEIALLAEAPELTRISIYASNFGFGPFQMSHVEKHARNFRNNIESRASQHISKMQKQSTSNKDPIQIFRELAALRDSGVITQEECDSTKGEILKRL